MQPCEVIKEIRKEFPKDRDIIERVLLMTGKMIYPSHLRNWEVLNQGIAPEMWEILLKAFPVILKDVSLSRRAS